MLLVHQVGSVKIGEVVRYTVTYIPSQDRILPSPEKLHVRIRNTCALVLRGAFVHGPYTLCVSAYPATFNPNEKFRDARRYGVPEFEPMVKASSYWECELLVPENIRQDAGIGNKLHFGKGPEHDSESVSWVIEVASQVIFSSSAAVSFEVLVARDKKSLDLSTNSSVPRGAQPGRVSDHQPVPEETCTCLHHHHLLHHHHAQPKGVFSRAIRLKVEDTGVLWNTPPLPQWPVCQHRHVPEETTPVPQPRRKQKNIHLVVLTHGLHSNLGSDMLFLKESIDAAVKKAKADARARRARERAERGKGKAKDGKTPARDDPGNSGMPSEDQGDDRSIEEDPVEEDEEVIVRGFSGNATRTERGIKYLGKRLARYILSMTYPDQPYIPPSSQAAWQSLWAETTGEPKSQVKRKLAELEGNVRPFKITSISFIGHSLGGLIQTYAIAYCQKHSPEIFNLIRPVNFIALASPFLGLGNENPLYIRFALDSGLVGRTGQDLGLAWRAPILARNGFDAIMSNLGDMAQKKLKGENPESKPLLRILPTGPAHTALKKFRNRTVYSNVVNDGIVPLRTSCLLFLDWQGLGRVDKARRDAGLVGTAIGFGWAELTGTSLSTARRPQLPPEEEEEEDKASGSATPYQEDSHIVPQPSQDAMLEDDRQSLMAASIYRESSDQPRVDTGVGQFTNFFSSLFRINENPKSPPPTPKSPSPAPTGKQSLIYRRSQTIKSEDSSGAHSSSTRSRVTSGSELDDTESSVTAPPTTTIFESAHDLINPQVPDLQFLLDPAKRPRAIFHDRVYHPEDIPPPPVKKRGGNGLNMRRRTSGNKNTPSGAATPVQLPHPSERLTQETIPDCPLSSNNKSATETELNGSSRPSDKEEKGKVNGKEKEKEKGIGKEKEGKQDTIVDGSSMRVEEKIARAYHHDLSWRKVLVKLEPDAHNNIIVRRMFANAFGWPVVHHLVEAHFSDTVTARRLDSEEDKLERAFMIHIPPDRRGSEVRDAVPAKESDANADRAKEDTTPHPLQRTASEVREAEDIVADLPATPTTTNTAATPTPTSVVPRSPWDSAEDAGSRSRPGTASGSMRSVVRVDSVTWSDRDWADSENDSELETSPTVSGSTGAKPGSPGFGVGAAWNWTEKIVGKKHPPRSRTPTLKAEATLAESSGSQAESDRTGSQG